MVALLAGAWAFQLWGGLAPCELCLWQRWPHYAVLVLALVSLPLLRHALPRLIAAFMLLYALAWLAGAGIAGFHVGDEQGWWEGLAACGAGGIDGALSLEALKAQILAAPVIRCDAIAWSLFGISLAGYNFLITGTMALAAVAAAVGLNAPAVTRERT